MAGSNLNWHQIRADFNDANSAMRNAQSGFSQAGTVFGQLRKSILDEEQRAVDNAYREQAFNENVRQFGLKYALDKDRFDESVRQFGLSHGETVRHNKASEANQAAMRDLQLAEFNDKITQRKQEQEARQRYYDWTASENEKYQKELSAYNQRLNAFKEKEAINSTSFNQLTGHISDMQAQKQDTEQKIAQLEAQKLAIQNSGQTSANRNRLMALEAAAMGAPDPYTPTVNVADKQVADIDAQIKELKDYHNALSSSEYAASQGLQGMTQKLADWVTANPEPVNALPIDPVSRAMMFERMTGLPVSKEFLGALAVASVENATKQAINAEKINAENARAANKDQTTINAALIRAGADSKGKDSTRFGSIRQDYRPLAVTVSDLLQNRMKQQGKTVDKKVIDAVVKNTLFSQTAWSRVAPTSNYTESPEGFFGSVGSVNDVIELLTTGGGTRNAQTQVAAMLSAIESMAKSSK